MIEIGHRFSQVFPPKGQVKIFLTIAKSTKNHKAKFAKFFIIFHKAHKLASKCRKDQYTNLLSKAVQVINKTGHKSAYTALEIYVNTSFTSDIFLNLSSSVLLVVLLASICGSATTLLFAKNIPETPSRIIIHKSLFIIFFLNILPINLSVFFIYNLCISLLNNSYIIIIFKKIYSKYW
ncbi:MAG: hypothetical protein BWY04_00563 [candidate division CPR1 bacterium ADurb.Bin160]|jgi:hypothetical protein|uniref:Uncharacterized protein n=1 Tax=candidate division CPR1 bacterium ADurb.Bin160 TaxID=1852826 RepID=A0A1V5ZNQ1_9BACT|nr:MAG: hypothetical protein BWY04_00563 [candidate division CPR1 bacterium ADurb.Bin160]